MQANAVVTNRRLNLKPLQAKALTVVHRLFVQFQYVNVEVVVRMKCFLFYFPKRMRKVLYLLTISNLNERRIDVCIQIFSYNLDVCNF
jgi:hypothetical protein